MFRLSALFAVLTIAAALGGCAGTSDVYHPENARAEGPKVIAIQATRLPWVVDIEKQLRADGFRILRFASQRRRIEPTKDGALEAYDKATARYVMIISGAAPLSPAHRCIAGGYKFDFISVEIIDTQTNESLATYSGSGYSENCAPLSGTVFHDIAKMTNDLWAK